jgi:hypothetical protein
MSYPENEPNNALTPIPAATEMWAIWGGQGTVDTNGDTARISHEEAEALRSRIRGELEPHVQTVVYDSDSPLLKEPINRRMAIPPAELAGRYNTGLQVCAFALAKDELRNRDVSRLTVIAGALSEGWHEGGEHVGLTKSPLQHKSEVVARLACSVAMLEGNFPPNGRGDRLDQIVGLARRSEFVDDNLNYAYDILRAQPDLFGDIDDARLITNGAVNRLERRHPTLAGRIVGKPFPRFA